MKGLYKSENGQLMWAANKIHFPSGTVIEVSKHIKKAEGTEVQDGWRVFYTREAALKYYGIEEEINLQIENKFSTFAVCNCWWCRLLRWFKIK